jgi:hypothetical protein
MGDAADIHTTLNASRLAKQEQQDARTRCGCSLSSTGESLSVELITEMRESQPQQIEDA